MIRRRHVKYPPGAQGNDIEALQTDVMRFMSIIGLCLMAVFALVQGIPVQEKSKSTQSLQATRLREEVRVQRQELQELQSMLQALKADMQRKQRLLAVAEQDLDQVTSQAQAVRDERERLEAEAVHMERRLARGQVELSDIEQATKRKTQDLAVISGRVMKVQEELARSRRKIAALEQQARDTKPEAVAESRQTPAPSARPVSDRQGFTLRFVSGAALDSLVTAGSVTLYAMANRQAWQLSMDTGRPAAVRGTYPGWFHEMSAVTVPEHYIQGLDNAPDGPATSDVVWGVQLPVATRQAIASLTQGRQGGELVIRADGRVVIGD